ncbi:MAG: hypothetical protein RIS65_1663, partial [Pseudomonadota bacterium]
ESFDAATSNRISISGSTLTIDPTNNLAGNTRYFVVFSSGNVRDLAGNAYRGTSTYDFTTASATPTDDFPNSNATTGVVTIGGAATTGSIETTGDVDLFRISLTAGVTYAFNLNATSGSLDPLLQLWQLNNSSWERLAYNDNYGSSLNAQITFTATSSGTYYLQALDVGISTGTYSLRATISATGMSALNAMSVTPADRANIFAPTNPDMPVIDAMLPTDQVQHSESPSSLSPQRLNSEFAASSNTEGSNNIIDITEAQILLALANSNDLFVNAKLALHNSSFSEGDQVNYAHLDHALDMNNSQTSDAFHFGTADVLERFLKNELALTRTEFNAVIFDPIYDWVGHTEFDPAISHRDDVVFDATHFGVSNVVNGYHQVDFIL